MERISEEQRFQSVKVNSVATVQIWHSGRLPPSGAIYLRHGTLAWLKKGLRSQKLLKHSRKSQTSKNPKLQTQRTPQVTAGWFLDEIQFHSSVFHPAPRPSWLLSAPVPSKHACLSFAKFEDETVKWSGCRVLRVPKSCLASILFLSCFTRVSLSALLWIVLSRV